MKRAEDEWLVRKMDTVVGTVTKAASLIDRLLAFSRKRPAKAQVLSLNRAVEGLEKMMRRLIGANIRLETRLPANLWLCEIDLAQLEQVIVNLLVNARDAMPTGGRLLLETANEKATDPPLVGPLAERDRVVLRVSDTGTGIPLEIRDKIFEPFFTTKESVGGSGLGLSTVYGVVRQSGGEISVASREGGGTSFEIRLPRSTQPETPIEALEDGEGYRSNSGNEQILLVDDNESFRQSTAALLQALDYQVTSAASGDEALAAIKARTEPFDVVLTDVVMPGMGGRQLFDLLGGKNTPLIFMSGYSESVLERHGIGADEVEILKKPFSAIEMTRLLRRVLSQRSPAADS
jgi:CheY-like chemotaxis protein